MTILIALVEIGMFVAVTVLFGLAPIATQAVQVSDQVVGFNNISEYLTKEVVPNFFIGPSSSSLIHSGAMYTPVRFLYCVIYLSIHKIKLYLLFLQCIRDNREFQLLVARTSYEESKLRCCKSRGLNQCGMLPQDM